jgi:hypothetical protein
VARIIREHILGSAGGSHRGNLYVHCGGGMHRTGVIMGILEKCINGASLEALEANYRYHAGYQDAEHPGGYEPSTVRFIREFDCQLLSTTGSASSAAGSVEQGR